MTEKCPLCNLDRKDETVHYEDGNVIILDAKNKKGHKYRMMVVYRKHIKKPDVGVRKLVFETFRNFCFSYYFSKVDRFGIYQDTYSTIPGHYHMLSADFDPHATDIEQVKDTERIEYLLKYKEFKQRPRRGA